MPLRRVRWHQLIPGLIALAILLVSAVAVLAFARVGNLRGATYRLYAVSEQASGVMKGTEVWLAGKKIGIVDDVHFRAPRADSAGTVVIAVDLARQYQPLIRRDSRTELRAGGSLIGAPVVFIQVGSPGAPALTDGDTLAPARTVSIDSITTGIAVAQRDFPTIARNVHTIAQDLHRIGGRVNGRETERGGEIDLLASRASGLGQRARAGGTIALFLHDQALLARAAAARARADSLQLLIASGRSTFGRFRRDSSLVQTLADARDELSIVHREMLDERGTVGRMMADSALTWRLGEAEAALAQLIADIKRDPARYIAF